MPPDDGVSVIDDVSSIEGEAKMDPAVLGFFVTSLIEGRDRGARNANTLDHVLGLDFAGSNGFRDSLSYRTASESAGGQSRATTAYPGPFTKEQTGA